MTFASGSQYHVYLLWSVECLNSVSNVKALVEAFNQVKAIIGAFSVIVKLRKCSFPALLPIDSILFAVTFEPINKQFPVTLVFALCYTSQISSDSVVGGEIKFLLLKIKVQFLDFLPCCGCGPLFSSEFLMIFCRLQKGET